MKLRNLLKEKMHQEQFDFAAVVTYHEYNDKIFATVEYFSSEKTYYVLLHGFSDFAELADKLQKKIKTAKNNITNYIEINAKELGILKNWMNKFPKALDSEIFDNSSEED